MPVWGRDNARLLAAQWAVLCLILGLCFTQQAWAQAIPAQDLPTIKNQQNQIQQKHTDDVRKQRDQRREYMDTPPKGSATPKVDVPPGLENGACVDVNAFDIQGEELLPADVLAEMTDGYVGKCLNLEQINTLLADISNWYMDRGYVTTRAYLPPQDLNTGTLQIIVVEGRIEDISFVGDEDRRERLFMAFPHLRGKRLNIRDLEQGLDQLNRMSSNNAKLNLEPGAKTGETVVRIENQRGQRIYFTATEDNTGSGSTNIRQRTLESEANDLLGINDIWTVSYKAGSRNTSGKLSKTLSTSLEIPYGYWTFSYSDSYFEYASTIEATTSSYESTGSSRTTEFSADRVFHRDQDSKSSLEAVLTRKDARNYIASSELESQSRRLSILGLTLHHSDKITGGSFSGSLTYDQGIRSFGAKKDDEHVSGEARAQFKRISSSLSYGRSFTAFEQNLYASLSATGQWAPGVLYSSERQSIGSLSTVRGFKDDSLSGDVGGYARSEFSWTAPKTDISYIDKALGSISPYVGADIGWIQDDPAEDGEGGVLAGVALGLRASGGWLTFDVSLAEALKSHHSLAPEGRVAYVSVSVEY